MKMGRRRSGHGRIGYVSIQICALLASCRRPILIATKAMLFMGQDTGSIFEFSWQPCATGYAGKATHPPIVYPKILFNAPDPTISFIDRGSPGALSSGSKSKLHHPTSCHLPSLKPTRR